MLAHTIGRLCEGQIEELRHTYNSARPESSYIASISGKTASLYATAARIGGLVAGFDRSVDRRAHRVRRGVRHRVPDRRRSARHHLDRRPARQARRPRHGRGRVHACRCCARCRPAACRRWSCWRCWASRSTPRSARRRSGSFARTAASPSAFATAQDWADRAVAACDALPDVRATEALRAAPANLIASVA